MSITLEQCQVEPGGLCYHEVTLRCHMSLVERCPNCVQCFSGADAPRQFGCSTRSTFGVPMCGQCFGMFSVRRLRQKKCMSAIIYATVEFEAGEFGLSAESDGPKQPPLWWCCSLQRCPNFSSKRCMHTSWPALTRNLQ